MYQKPVFSDRAQAGLALADEVKALNLRDCVVIGLPRGGVPVAAEVARAIEAPLDVIVVRKLGLPEQPEVGFGAIGEDAVQVLNPEIVGAVGLTQAQIDEIASKEKRFLQNRVLQIRALYPEVPLRNKTVVIVDDGIATGIDARAACRVAKARGATRVILAVPVAPWDWQRRLSSEADDFITVIEANNLRAVGEFYEDFAPVEDEEMLSYLNEN
ncbi:MAG: hypothetical protein RLZZ426_263 [Actinomycetota bacterium]|jgi:putative phosphoribosyl transferase